MLSGIQLDVYAPLLRKNEHFRDDTAHQFGQIGRLR